MDKLTSSMMELKQTSECIIVDVQAGKISIEEARECLEIDRQRNQQRLQEFFKSVGRAGLTQLHQRLWRESIVAYDACRKFLNNQTI